MPKDEELNFENMDLTDPAEVEKKPIIEPVEGLEDTDEVPAAEPADEAPVPEADSPDDAPEEPSGPDFAEIVSESIDRIAETIDALTAKVDALEKMITELNTLEQTRAVGPQGFFKPLEDGRGESQGDPLPRIERKYI